MGMSNAERQRKFRLSRDADPERRHEYLQKCKKKYIDDKALGKKKLVKYMTSREKRHARKQWRTRKKKAKENKKRMETITSVTPPSSPDSGNTPPRNTPPRNTPSSRQKEQSTANKAKEKAKCYRENKQLAKEIAHLKKKTQLYKQRWLREKASKKMKDSPRTKTKLLLRNLSNKSIRKTLYTYNVLVKSMQTAYKEAKKRDKIKITRSLSASVLRKYRCKSATFKLIRMTARDRKQATNCLSKRIYRQVKEFYLRDDNSRVVTGQKQTVTRKKKKKQRRLLCDTLITLHKKFQLESKTKMSYNLFRKMRPFWVLIPSESDRKTCMCKKCDNVTLMASSLYKSNILKSDNLHDLLTKRVCDVNSYKCMYGQCSICDKNKWTLNNEKHAETITWFRWTTRREERTIKDGNTTKQKQVTYTTKESLTDTCGHMIEQFNGDFEDYMQHMYKCWAQFKYMKQSRENLQDTECIIHVDFSENFVCKMAKEIQSMHFGASKNQLTLHTGVWYVGQDKRETFSTVSESLNHSPSGIWAHLKKILKGVKQQHPAVNSIEFFSDGPTTQYRQKGNFYLLSTEPKKMGFDSVKWSFFEAGHGKGIPDAVGGALKRGADQKVRYGNDIMSAESFVEQMQHGKPKVMLVTEAEIELERQNLEQTKIKTIPGTMQLHQVIVRGNGTIAYRNLSCVCDMICALCCETLKNSNIVEGTNVNNTNKAAKRKVKRTEEQWAKKPKYESNKDMKSGNIDRTQEPDEPQNPELSEKEHKKTIYESINTNINARNPSKAAKRKMLINEELKVKMHNYEWNKDRKSENIDKNQELDDPQKPEFMEEQKAKKPKYESNNDMNAKNINRNQGRGGHHKPECTTSKPEASQSNDITSSKIQDLARKKMFEKHLHELNRCKTYTVLKKKCHAIQLDKYILSPQDISLCSNAQESHEELEADFVALEYMPDDVQTDTTLCACAVNADGNCLPSCGSVFAFGHTDNVEEMRVRIVKELAENENVYLDDNFLMHGNGSSSSTKDKVKPSWNYTQYSKAYIPGKKLDKTTVRNLYRKEVMSITEDGSYMGIWQLHALSTILNKPIYSVYPKLGNTYVRKDLNKLIVPRSGADQGKIHILWTSTRDDMTREHWVPNHFVPLLPITPEEKENSDNEAEIVSNPCESSVDANEEIVTIYVYDGKKIDAIVVTDSIASTVDTSCESQCVIDGTEMIDKRENKENATNGSHDSTCETVMTAKNYSVENTACESQTNTGETEMTDENESNENTTCKNHQENTVETEMIDKIESNENTDCESPKHTGKIEMTDNNECNENTTRKSHENTVETEIMDKTVSNENTTCERHEHTCERKSADKIDRLNDTIGESHKNTGKGEMTDRIDIKHGTLCDNHDNIGETEITDKNESINDTTCESYENIDQTEMTDRIDSIINTTYESRENTGETEMTDMIDIINETICENREITDDVDTMTDNNESNENTACESQKHTGEIEMTDRNEINENTTCKSDENTVETEMIDKTERNEITGCDRQKHTDEMEVTDKNESNENTTTTSESHDNTVETEMIDKADSNENTDCESQKHTCEIEMTDKNESNENTTCKRHDNTVETEMIDKTESNENTTCESHKNTCERKIADKIDSINDTIDESHNNAGEREITDMIDIKHGTICENHELTVEAEMTDKNENNENATCEIHENIDGTEMIVKNESYENTTCESHTTTREAEMTDKNEIIDNTTGESHGNIGETENTGKNKRINNTKCESCENIDGTEMTDTIYLINETICENHEITVEAEMNENNGNASCEIPENVGGTEMIVNNESYEDTICESHKTTCGAAMTENNESIDNTTGESQLNIGETEMTDRNKSINNTKCESYENIYETEMTDKIDNTTCECHENTEKKVETEMVDKSESNEDVTCENHEITGETEMTDMDMNENINADCSMLITDVRDPITSLNKYVLVKYNRRPYPGIVEDATATSLLVKCMKATGKKGENRFMWPRTVTDRSWYGIDDIIGIIPQPENVEGISSSHYKVSDDIWKHLEM